MEIFTMNNKIAGFILIFCIFSLNAAEARLSLPKSHVKVYDTVINNVDAATKASLESKKAEVTQLKADIKAYKDAGDSTAARASAKSLRAKQRELDKSLRSAIKNDTNLQSTIASEKRTANAAGRFAKGASAKKTMDKILAAASSSQSSSLESNKTSMASILTDIKNARQGGATKEDTQSLRDQLTALQSQQRATIKDIIDSNADLQASLKADAKKQARKSAKGKRNNKSRNARQPRNKSS